MQDARGKLERRLGRWELWASLWLARLLAALGQADGAMLSPPLRRWFSDKLDRLARHVMNIILIRTAMQSGFQAAKRGHATATPRMSPFRGSPFNRRRTSLRAVMGAELRKTFRAQTLQERARKILLALENRDALIAKLARRLLRGMSRRAVAHTLVAMLCDASLPVLSRNPRSVPPRTPAPP